MAADASNRGTLALYDMSQGQPAPCSKCGRTDHVRAWPKGETSVECDERTRSVNVTMELEILCVPCFARRSLLN